MSKVMGGIFKGIGIVFKSVFVSVLLAGDFIMNLVGVLICAITSQR